MEDLHQATTFNDVLRVEAGETPSSAQVVQSPPDNSDDNQIDSTAVNKNKGWQSDEDDEQMP